MSDGINLQSAIFYLLNFCTLYFINPNTFILMIIFVLIIFIFLNSTGKIFLGDSGVYFLSIVLSFYSIKYYSFNTDLKADHIFLFLFFPVLDASRCFVSRLIVGKSIFLADDNHFHHILLKKINYKKTIIILSSIYLIPFVGYFFEINSVFLLISIMMIYFILLIRYKS
jgi:UDP-GlcNAc:undecaprenyl-phosphate/decaprenyl-phosphate GlcNAc-1-phosphate transferase